MRLTYSSQCGARVVMITALRMAAIVNKMIAQVGGGMRNDLVGRDRTANHWVFSPHRVINHCFAYIRHRRAKIPMAAIAANIHVLGSGTAEVKT